MEDTLVKVRFQGKDGSMGYRKGCIYMMQLHEHRPFLGIGRSRYVLRPMGTRTTPHSGPIPYDSIRAFEANWKILETY